MNPVTLNFTERRRKRCAASLGPMISETFGQKREHNRQNRASNCIGQTTQSPLDGPARPGSRYVCECG
jgi:hypothetical protein